MELNTKTQRHEGLCRLSLFLAFFVLPLIMMAQGVHYDKLSPMLRRIARQQVASSHLSPNTQHPTPNTYHQPPTTPHPSSVCAFVKVTEGGEDILRNSGCRVLTQVGDICIADIPLTMVGRLSLDSRILRIEANTPLTSHPSPLTPQTDSLAWYLNALPVYAGQNLPQAFTGKGIVTGVMDIGFDLTHPNFYSRDTTEYRIQCFWDMLSADTVGSTLYVGRDYVGRNELLAMAHSRDGEDQSHGTHTLGIAAGSGYDFPYRGMAPESDICLVANAVSEDIVFIDSADYYKYTFATDALGFKYIFDYAESVGKPCVINFSEGSQQDFWGYDILYYEMLERMTGPGRIIVSAAGNNGADKTWFRKERGQHSEGSFLRASSKAEAMITLKAAENFDLQVVAYDYAGNDTLIVNIRDVLQQPDSVFLTRMFTQAPKDSLHVLIEAYPSCYVPSETCYDVTFIGRKSVGVSPKLSFEVIGEEADVEVYRVSGHLIEDDLNPLLNAGETTHTVLSPASSSGIICVGSTFYRDGVINYKGEWQAYKNGPQGERQFNSSIGPTFDGRIKPDVMAPGLHIISSFSSYYIENHPDLLDWDVVHFPFNDRIYGWNCMSGTSMASPAVAGAIALWLQAKPDLTTEQILDVFKHTCRHFDESLPYPNNEYGYGEIDVYGGLLYLLEADRIEGVSTNQTKARVSVRNGRLCVDMGQAGYAATLRLFSLSGRQIMTTTLPDGLSLHTISLPRLPQGVYVVQIDGPASISGSTLVRL